jgi:hypothetical protein
MLRELTMEEIEYVSGMGRKFIGYYQDENGVVAVYQENGVITDVKISNDSGDDGWDYDPGGYFGTIGVGMAAGFGVNFSYDFSHNNPYGSIEGGFGTPVTAQVGHSENVSDFLGGSSVTVTSGNPGVPVASINRETVNVNTHIIGTPSAGWSYGVNLSDLGTDLGQWMNENWQALSAAANAQANAASAAVADLIENGSGPRP